MEIRKPYGMVIVPASSHSWPRNSTQSHNIFHSKVQELHSMKNINYYAISGYLSQDVLFANLQETPSKPPPPSNGSNDQKSNPTPSLHATQSKMVQFPQSISTAGHFLNEQRTNSCCLAPNKYNFVIHQMPTFQAQRSRFLVLWHPVVELVAVS